MTVVPWTARDRMSRWWKPRKSTPSPSTVSPTIRVLAASGRKPRSASRAVNRATAACACPFDRHITTTSSAYVDRRIMPTVV